MRKYVKLNNDRVCLAISNEIKHEKYCWECGKAIKFGQMVIRKKCGCGLYHGHSHFLCGVRYFENADCFLYEKDRQRAISYLKHFKKEHEDLFMLEKL